MGAETKLKWPELVDLIMLEVLLIYTMNFSHHFDFIQWVKLSSRPVLPEFSAMQTLPALNIEDIGGTPGGHIWDTWDTFELALRPYLGRQLTFTAPTKCDPSAGHYSGHPPSPLLHLLGD